MDIHLINQRLRDIHGVDFLGQPNYRVVWSADLIEKRFSTFEDYIPNTNIFLRRVTEVREVKKYNYLEPQYVLEKLFVNKHNKEILDNDTLAPSACTYEPMYAFGHEPNGKPREVIWRFVELIIKAVNNPIKKTPSELNEEEIQQMQKDEDLMRKYLDETIPNDPLHIAVKDGGAVMLGDRNGR